MLVRAHSVLAARWRVAMTRIGSGLPASRSTVDVRSYLTAGVLTGDAARRPALAAALMATLTRITERRLILQANAQKSAVARPWQRSFPCFTVIDQAQRHR